MNYTPKAADLVIFLDLTASGMMLVGRGTVLKRNTGVGGPNTFLVERSDLLRREAVPLERLIPYSARNLARAKAFVAQHNGRIIKDRAAGKHDEIAEFLRSL